MLMRKNGSVFWVIFFLPHKNYRCIAVKGDTSKKYLKTYKIVFKKKKKNDSQESR